MKSDAVKHSVRGIPAAFLIMCVLTMFTWGLLASITGIVWQWERHVEANSPVSAYVVYDRLEFADNPIPRDKPIDIYSFGEFFHTVEVTWQDSLYCRNSGGRVGKVGTQPWTDKHKAGVRDGSFTWPLMIAIPLNAIACQVRGNVTITTPEHGFEKTSPEYQSGWVAVE